MTAAIVGIVLALGAGVEAAYGYAKRKGWAL